MSSVPLAALEQSAQEGSVPSGQSNRFTIVRLALGGLLLVAAALKAHQLATAPVAETGLLTSRWFLITVVESELAIGLWFLGGWHPRAIRVVGIACFALFGGLALYKALQGAESCGCFGRVAFSPWWTAVIDLAAALALIFSRPPSYVHNICIEFKYLSSRIVVASVLFVIVGIPAGWAMATFSPSHIGSDGLLGDGQTVILEPKEWVGKMFPLTAHIDIGEQLKSGAWKVVLYHHDCPKCQEAIAKWENAVLANDGAIGTSRIALIEMPPYGPKPHATSSPDRIVYGRLSEQREWFVTAPVEIDLHQGTVIGAGE